MAVIKNEVDEVDDDLDDDEEPGYNFPPCEIYHAFSGPDYTPTSAVDNLYLEYAWRSPDGESVPFDSADRIFDGVFYTQCLESAIQQAEEDRNFFFRWLGGSYILHTLNWDFEAGVARYNHNISFRNLIAWGTWFAYFQGLDHLPEPFMQCIRAKRSLTTNTNRNVDITWVRDCWEEFMTIWRTPGMPEVMQEWMRKYALHLKVLLIMITSQGEIPDGSDVDLLIDCL